MKTWRWAAILSIIAIAGAFLSVYLLTASPKGSIAGVYSDGALVCTVDVRNPASFREFDVAYGSESNTISIDAGGIRIISASCPDKLCVKQGYLGAAPIVCLPNKLVIKWVNGADNLYDAVVG